MAHQLRLREIGTRPDEHTPAIARHNAVHCLQSGLSEPSLQLSRVYPSLLADAVESVWTAVPEMISLEILALTGVEPLTVVFHGSRTDAHNTGWMGPNTEETDTIGTDELTAALRSRLPEWYGIEQGTLVLDPVGLAAIPTSRLLYEGNSPPVSDYESILRSILQDNHSHNIPTVCQLLLCRSLHRRYQSDPELLYRVTLRVAELSTAPRPLGRFGFADSIETPRECPIDWETPASITSSRRLADRHWGVKTSQSAQSSKEFYTVDPTSTTARWYKGPVSASSAALAVGRLRDSTHEYAAMLQGVEGLEPYVPLDVRATLALSSTDLSSLLDVTPLYESCKWPAGVSRGPPRFIRDRVCSQAAGTAHTEVLADPDSSMSQRGLQAGPSLWEFTRGWLGEGGCLSSSHANRTLGSPHFVGHPIDPDGPVVLFDPLGDCRTDHDNGHDVSLVESAGELIVAANNAAHNGSHLLVVTPTEALAEQARSILSIPYAAQVGPSDYELYTVPKAVTTDDGVIVVERETPPLSWRVSGGTHRSLHTPERCLSSGPLTEPVAAQQYATPRMCGIDPPIEMAEPDGTVRQTVPSRSACMDDYRPVLYPVAPIAPLFCDTVSVVYRDGTELTEPLSSRDWTPSTEEPTPEGHIECALERFADQYTSEQLFGRTPGFFQEFRSWYGHHSTHKLCHVERLGQLLPDGVGVRTNMMGDPTGITGRHWWIDTGGLSLAVLHDF